MLNWTNVDFKLKIIDRRKLSCVWVYWFLPCLCCPLQLCQTSRAFRTLASTLRA